MANYRMVLDQHWEANDGSLRSRASSVISTGTKFSFSTLAHEEHPNIDGVLGRLNSVACRGRPASTFSYEEPAPPYDEQGAPDRSRSPTMNNGVLPRTRPPTPVAEESVRPSNTPPSDSENAISNHYTRIIRSLDESHARELFQLDHFHKEELSALRASLNDAQERIELLKKEHEQQLAATRNEIDQTYRKEFKDVRREMEKTREQAATEVAVLRQKYENAIVKARNAIEDLWEARWNDRIRVAAEEVERIETASEQRQGRAAERIKKLAARHPELAEELNSTAEELSKNLNFKSGA